MKAGLVRSRSWRRGEKAGQVNHYWESDKALQTNPVHTRQHGFRADRNIVTAISEVTDFREQNIFFNKHVLAVFLDIQATFDTISLEKIKKCP